MQRSLNTIKEETQQVYDRYAHRWDEERPKVFYEKVWIEKLLETLPATSDLLDLGCGAGDPIAGFILEKGFALTGIDYAPGMIALARQRYPQGNWLVGDIRDIPVEMTFEGIFSWDGFFHLSIEEQRIALPRIIDLVKLGGTILLTVGHYEGETTGTVCGETVYHASLSPEEYRRILTGSGFSTVEIVTEDVESHGRSVLFATGK